MLLLLLLLLFLLLLSSSSWLSMIITLHYSVVVFAGLLYDLYYFLFLLMTCFVFAFRDADVLMCWCAGVPMCWCAGARVCSSLFHFPWIEDQLQRSGRRLFTPARVLFTFTFYFDFTQSLFTSRCFRCSDSDVDDFCSDVFIPDGYLTLLK